MKRNQQKNKRMVLGVSACLLGEKVRYDGGHKCHGMVVSQLSKYYELLPVCPEIMAGLGVPRAAVQLVDVDGCIKALGVDDNSLDVTRLLASCGEASGTGLAHLSGFVFKSRSPSCGYGSTPIHNEQRKPVGIGNGLFAHYLTQHQPQLPVIEERQLDDAGLFSEFIQRVNAFCCAVD